MQEQANSYCRRPQRNVTPVTKWRKREARTDSNHYENEPGRRSAAKLLTKDEARRIAVNIAELPDFLANPKGAYRL
jgi:hypothetical protein